MLIFLSVQRCNTCPLLMFILLCPQPRIGRGHIVSFWILLALARQAFVLTFITFLCVHNTSQTSLSIFFYQTYRDK